MQRFLEAQAQAQALFRQDGREGESIPLFEKALKHARRASGWQSCKKVADAMVDLGTALLSVDRISEAVRQFDEAEELANAHLGGEDSRDVLFCLSLARQCTAFSFLVRKGVALFGEEGREAEAANVMRGAFEQGKREYPQWRQCGEVLRCGAQLVEVLVHAEQTQEALELSTELLPLLRKAGETCALQVVCHRMAQLGEMGETRAFKKSFALGIRKHLAGEFAQARSSMQCALEVCFSSRLPVIASRPCLSCLQEAGQHMSALCFQASVNVGTAQVILGDCLGKERDWEEAACVTQDALDHLALLVDKNDELVGQARRNLQRFRRVAELSVLLGVGDAQAEARFRDTMEEAMPLIRNNRHAEADPLLRKALSDASNFPGWSENKAMLSGLALAAANMTKLGAIKDALHVFVQLREPVGRAFGRQSNLYCSICESIQVM